MADGLHAIDGTTLEGGGQLVRIAVGLSALSGIPIHVSDIRGGRPRGGGLKTQHLAAVNWLKAACDAAAIGADQKSKTLKFIPAPNKRLVPSKHHSFSIDMDTPGAVTLIFQAILPFIVFSGAWTKPVRITMQGGTNVSFSPSVDYLNHVLLPTLARIGLPPITCKVNWRGWSTGRAQVGSVTFTITPMPRGQTLPAFELRQPGEVVKFTAIVLAPPSYFPMFSRELDTCFQKKQLDVPLESTFEDSNHEKRLYLLLVAETSDGHLLGRDLLYERKITSPLKAVSDIVTRVSDEILEEISNGGCVDEYMQDQLVIFQALAKGESVVHAGTDREPSLHTRTARWIVESLLGISFSDEGSCEGVAFVVGRNVESQERKDDSNASTDGIVESVQKLGL